MAEIRRVHAPGRVNLIGDHTDYTGGLVFPMAIDRGTTIEYTSGGSVISLRSDAESDPLRIDVPFSGDASAVTPRWGTYVAAMSAEVGSAHGLTGTVASDIPAGAGLSSSAALECAVGLALGFDGSPTELALAARRAEHAATGVPTGIMDQLCIAAAKRGDATMIDCHSLEIVDVAIPSDLDIVVEFVAHRTLVGSAYADRVAECTRAEGVIGPLRLASPADVEGAAGVLDDVAWRRARHVVTENQRVRDFAAALSGGDYVAAGEIMTDGHRSLRVDFETSTATMDAAVERCLAIPGVLGARMTGGGFGGCIVAIARPGTATPGFRVRAAEGARHL